MKAYVTGVGAITPVGDTAEESWQSILKSEHAIETVSAFDPTNYRTKVAAEVKTDLLEYGEKLSPNLPLKHLDDTARMAIIATHMAIENAKLSADDLESMNSSVILGTGLGGILFAEDAMNKIMSSYPYQPRQVHPLTVPYVDPNFIVSIISRIWKLYGIQYSVCTACSSGTHSIGQALMMIRSGRADMVVTGGMEKTIAPLTYSGFDQLRAMTTSNDNVDNASVPFSAHRSGFVLGEGAATLIIESEAMVEKRGIEPLAELVGYGASGGAYHMVKPNPDATDIVLSMQRAIDDADINPSDIGAINAHGTSTKLNDKSELSAINTIFSKNKTPPILAANKGNIGHSLGVSGAIEAVFSVKTLMSGLHAPMLNFKADDSLDYSYVHIPTSMVSDNSVDYILSNSFGFGNNNATIILKRCS